jgi:hypothetical protein
MTERVQEILRLRHDLIPARIPELTSEELTQLWQASPANSKVRSAIEHEQEKRRHKELIEATKASAKTGDVNIAAGRDVTVVSSNLVAGDLSQKEPTQGGDKSKKIIQGIAIGLLVGVVTGLIVAYMKGCFPSVLR